MRSQSEIIKQQPQKWCKLISILGKSFSLSVFSTNISKRKTTFWKLNIRNFMLYLFCRAGKKRNLQNWHKSVNFIECLAEAKNKFKKNSHPRHFRQLSRGKTKEEVLDALGHNSSHALVWYGKCCNHNLLAFLYAIQIYTHSIPSNDSFESVWLIFMK